MTQLTNAGGQCVAARRPAGLRLRVEGGLEQFVFAKLYTNGHVPACSRPRLEFPCGEASTREG